MIFEDEFLFNAENYLCQGFLLTFSDAAPLSRGYKCDSFTCTDNKTLPFDVAVTVKPDSCKCSQTQIPQQNRWNNVGL